MGNGATAVNWYGKDVSLQVNKASQAILDKLATLGEGLAKTNIRENDQIDTGFMMNSMAAITSDGVGDVAPSGEYPNRSGELVMRQSVSLPAAEEGAAGIGCAAEYAIHQEMKRSFLYRALEQLRDQFGGVIEEVAKEQGDD